MVSDSCQYPLIQVGTPLVTRPWLSSLSHQDSISTRNTYSPLWSVSSKPRTKLEAFPTRISLERSSSPPLGHLGAYKQQE